MLEGKPELISVQPQVDNESHLENISDELDLNCAFWVDRLMICYYLLPNESFVQPSNSRMDGDHSEARLGDHVTILLVTNVTGFV